MAQRLRDFLDAIIDFASLESGERPDFWVRRDSKPDIALEVTEYHPIAHGLQGIRRAEVEGRWYREFEPMLDRLRRGRSALQAIQAHVDFKDQRLPRRSEQERLAAEIVAIAESVASRLYISNKEIETLFLPRKVIEQLHSCDWEEELLVEEDWPAAFAHLNSLSFQAWPGITDRLGSARDSTVPGAPHLSRSFEESSPARHRWRRSTSSMARLSGF